MRGAVNAARQTGGDDDIAGAEAFREHARDLASDARRVARADDRDRRPFEQARMAAHIKDGRRIGDFGELVYAGMDWVDPALGKRSMQLMAEEVMPRVNAAIGGSSTAKRAAG